MYFLYGNCIRPRECISCKTNHGNSKLTQHFEIVLGSVNICDDCAELIATAIQDEVDTSFQQTRSILQTKQLRQEHALFEIPDLLNIIVSMGNPLIFGPAEHTSPSAAHPSIEFCLIDNNNKI